MYETNNFMKIAALSNDDYRYDDIKQAELEDLLNMLDVPVTNEGIADWYGFETEY